MTDDLTTSELDRRLEVRRAERRLLAKLDRRLKFAIQYHTPTRQGRMRFDNRPYLVPIYLDRTRARTFKKSVQCGISEMLVIDALEAASRGLACLYVMPSQDRRDRFVANRVSRAIQESAFYRSLIRSGPGKANSTGLKHIGRGAISFVGSNAVNEFIEFPADLAIVDEYDRCSLPNLPLVRDRLAASPHKLVAYASTPTIAAFGIAELFEQSDAKEWMVRCNTCRLRQPLDFFQNVARRVDDDQYELIDRRWADNPCLDPAGPDAAVFCTRCGRPIDRLGPGEWVAAHPGRNVSGYHISQLFVPTARIGSMWLDWQKALKNAFERQRFFNSILGEPYAAEGSALDRSDLLDCCRDYALPKRAAACTMGVDVGQWMHVRISDRPQPGVRRAVFIGRVKTVQELDALIDRYDVRCCVVDALPETRLIRKWQESRPKGRIWRCVYTDNELRELRREPKDGVIHVARTPSLDDATEDILMRRNWLPRDAETLDGGAFLAQMLAPARCLVATPTGGQRFVWTKPGPDHYRHADNYDKIAAQLEPARAAVRPMVTGTRLTPLPPRGAIYRAA